MKMNRFICLAAIFVLAASCSKEVDLADIDGISNALANFETDIRVEAIIYPADSTILVRIDKTYSLGEDSLYNCLDDNGDWGYYHCTCSDCAYDDDIFYSQPDCESICDEGSCSQVIYVCPGTFSLQGFMTQEECEDNCQAACWTDDVGEDGVRGDPDDEDGDGNTSEPSEGEGNGVPDCGEPNVDDYKEVLPMVHVTDCASVTITDPDGGVHPLQFDPSAARLYSYPEYSDIEDTETYVYGGYIPLEPMHFPSSPDTPFEDRIYHLDADCGEFGSFHALDTLAMPVRFYGDSLGQLPLLRNIENYPEILEDLDQLGGCDIDNFMFLIQSEEGLSSRSVFYHSNPETRSFWSTALEVTEINFADCQPTDLYYIFGYPTYATTDYQPGDSVRVIRDVLAEIPGIFQFDVEAMSPAYERYFSYTDLSLKDPERSNLRDEGGNVVMGTFGGLSSAKLFAIILPPPRFSLGEPLLQPEGTMEVDILIGSHIRSGDFTIEITGATILDIWGGVADDPDNWNLQASGGTIQGTSAGSTFIPASNGYSNPDLLLHLLLDATNPICISGGTSYLPMADETVNVFTGPCVDVGE